MSVKKRPTYLREFVWSLTDDHEYEFTLRLDKRPGIF
jgi:hypothetical protein